MVYILDDDDRMIGMYYSINAGNYERFFYPGQEAREDYERLRVDLLDKYGQPVGEVSEGIGTLVAAHTHAFSEASTYPKSVIYTASECTQWIVRYDDCYCIVELFIRDENAEPQKSLGYVKGLFLSYRLVTADELNKMMEEATQQKKEEHRDI